MGDTIPLVNLEQIRKAARAHREELATMGITELYLFGSAARGKTAEGSDIDILYRRAKKAGGGRDSLHLSGGLSGIFGARTDAVNINLAGEDFLAGVMPHAVLIYGKTQPSAAYKKRTGKTMEKDKTRDARGVFARAETAAAKLQKLANGGGPEAMKNIESDAGETALLRAKDYINKINDALNGRLRDFIPPAARDEKALQALAEAGVLARHPYAAESEQAAANQLAEFTRNHSTAAEKMLAACPPSVRQK